MQRFFIWISQVLEEINLCRENKKQLFHLLQISMTKKINQVAMFPLQHGTHMIFNSAALSNSGWCDLPSTISLNPLECTRSHVFHHSLCTISQSVYPTAILASFCTGYSPHTNHHVFQLLQKHE